MIVFKSLMSAFGVPPGLGILIHDLVIAHVLTDGTIRKDRKIRSACGRR